MNSFRRASVPRLAVSCGVAAIAVSACGWLAAAPAAPSSAANPTAARGDAVAITYVANEGFLISGAGTKVLIDGIFTEGFGRFDTPAAEVLNEERSALPPFDHLDALLVTHYHPDHISPADVVRHLANDPQAVLIGPPQVGELLKPVDGYAAVAQQVRTVWPEPGAVVESTIGNLTIKSVALPHLSDTVRRYQNLGFLLRLGEFTLFHVGDADVSAPAAYHNLGLAGVDIDVALLNCYWFDEGNVDSARRVIGYLRPKAIVVMHQGARQVAHYRDLLGRLPDLPPVYLAESSLETLRFRRQNGRLLVESSRADGRP